MKNLTHKKIAECVGEDSNDKDAMAMLKVEHLAFFNKHPAQMRKSQRLWEFYESHEPEMLERIVAEKEKYDYTYTSRRLFEKEVEIMTRSIEKLNSQSIYVLYVFDALLCDPLQRATVESVMNEAALECGVYTATYEDEDTKEMFLESLSLRCQGNNPELDNKLPSMPNETDNFWNSYHIITSACDSDSGQTNQFIFPDNTGINSFKESKHAA